MKITLMLEYLKVLLHVQLPGIRGKSPLTEAIRCTLACMALMWPHVSHGILESDSNIV
jgi:hypothetical protein